jgi:uncharacterized protein (TIGR00255 family)
MIRSMTGFARRERQGPWGTLTCELRTVNHRYLEVSLRLPEDLRGLENDARQLVGANLRRTLQQLLDQRPVQLQRLRRGSR